MLMLALPSAGPVAAATDAPTVPATDTYHGVRVDDPFRNLEDLKAPATRAWMLAQGEATAAVLGRIEGRDAMAERVQQLARASGDRVSGYMRRGGQVFFLKRAAGENQFKLVVRPIRGGAERVLVDPERLAAASGVPHAINYFVPSWDGRTLAFGVSAGGSEQASLHLIDVAGGRALREPISRVNGPELHWSADNRWLSFNRLRELPPGAPESETYLDTTVFVIDRTRPAAEPRAVFGPLVDRSLGLERLDVGELMFSVDSPWMLARTTDSTVPEGRLFVARATELRRPRIAWRALATAADRITHVALRGSSLYFRSYAGAPRGRVLELPLALARPLASARVVVPEPERGVLVSFEAGARSIYTEQLAGFTTRVHRHDPRRPGAGVDAAPDLAGSTYANLDRRGGATELWVSTSTWSEPSRIWAVGAGGAAADTGLRTSRRPEGTEPIEVTQTEVASHDGVRVPVAVLHRKGLVLDGRNPTLLDGYGAYGLTTQAWFDPRRWAWFERGGVLAFVNPRGSGAYGDEWHRAGFKQTKPNTWKDGIAAARWLIERGYASSATLAVTGGSAGGVFAGRALTAAPELFAAAVLEVPVFDTLRVERTANGATNVSEFGTVAVEAEFRSLFEMSPYHQIRDGTAYPAVLLVHGLNDPRVDAWHSAKAAARLQQASSSGKPVLLRLDVQAGHGVGSTAQQVQSQMADAWSFLLWQFGRAALRP